jgi:hypothetical protein
MLVSQAVFSRCGRLKEYTSTAELPVTLESISVVAARRVTAVAGISP